jgi:DNA-directed RNA polymerase III subunit RPC4
MTASGPFAMGPTLAGTSARRTVPRANFTPIVPQGLGGTTRLGAGLTQTEAPTLGVKREPKEGGVAPKDRKTEDEVEVYSDPDEGVEIVDMDNVRAMDWMAPDSLKREKVKDKKKMKTEVKDAKTEGVWHVTCE